MRAAVVLAMPLAAALQTVETLGKRAQALRKTWNLRAPPSEPDFFFDSVFQGGEPETGSAGRGCMPRLRWLQRDDVALEPQTVADAIEAAPDRTGTASTNSSAPS